MTSRRTGVLVIAALEAAKGALVLLAGFGLLGLVHRDAQAVAERFVEHLHLNPAKHYPHVFIDAMASLTDARLWMLAWLAFCYAALRFTEAYALTRQRRWAAWFAVASGGVYLPVEIVEIALGLTWVKATALALNAVVVLYMGLVLGRERAAYRGASP